MRNLTNEEIAEILAMACDHGLKGFGGHCGAAAIAINRVLFEGRGRFIIAVNDALWTARKHFAGHVVISFNGFYWDSDAKPKTLHDIDDWGDLSEDSYYEIIAKDYGIRWTKKRSQKTALFELDGEHELPFGHDEAGELIDLLEKVQKEYFDKNKDHSSR
jgi:hypothetical protein